MNSILSFGISNSIAFQALIKSDSLMFNFSDCFIKEMNFAEENLPFSKSSKILDCFFWLYNFSKLKNPSL